VAVADLLEAEGRALRRSTARLGGSLVLFALAGLLAAGGLCLCFWGLYQYLAVSLGGTAAALLTGVTTVVIAGGLLWIGQRMSR
jgi:high-affinity Fe2+/Pb2+ permease